MKSAEVAVVMPVRNAGRYLGEALESLQRQTLKDIVIIVVNDGSTDESGAIVAARASRDARIMNVAARGSGIVDALNQGMAMAMPDYIARMDGDDVCEPERLAFQLAAMRDNPGLVLLGTSAIAIDAAGRRGDPIEVESDPVRLAASLSRSNPILHPTVMMRRAVVERCGGYRRPFTHAEDYDLWLRLSREGAIANLPQRLMLLRTHDEQTSKIHRLDQRAAAALARLWFFGPHIEGAHDLQQSLVEAIGGYLYARLASGPPIATDERKDVEILLRALSGHGALHPGLRAQALASFDADIFSRVIVRAKLLAGL